jgi:hypothetical protein
MEINMNRPVFNTYGYSGVSISETAVYVGDALPGAAGEYKVLTLAKAGYVWWTSAIFENGKFNKIIDNNIEFCVCFWKE